MTSQQDIQSQLVIGEALARAARKFPDMEALVFRDKRMTYRQFDEQVNRLANALLGLGISNGDKVAVLFTNCTEIIESYMALCKIGAVGVPINFRLVAVEMQYQLEHSDSVAIIFGEAFNEIIGEIRPQLPEIKNYISVSENGIADTLDYYELIRNNSADEPGVYVSDDDPAFIMYTSGTTGKPKGTLLTHKSMLLSVIHFLIDCDVRRGDRHISVAPMFHAMATSGSLNVIFACGTNVILEEFVPQEYLNALVKEKINVAGLAPVMWIFLLDLPDIEKYDTSNLRVTSVGSAFVPVELKRRIKKHFPNINIYDAFGQTEMSTTTTMQLPIDGLDKEGSVGRRLLCVDARVVDEDDNDVPQGEVGEIIYRGPTVMKGYYKNPEGTAEAMKGGWFHSGDLVREDEDGFLFVVDRKQEMIISGGENIYAAEVEDAIYKNHKVLETAVIGVPDPVWGESVKAIVVVKEGETLTEEELIEHCKENIASYKKPKSVDFIDTLPRNPTGKVLKFELREKYKS